ncbi:MAG: HAMP domain-containing sensor histidine kinase, partial [Bacillota bacterium]|nr:HAMP domain-containing sensor histidine kinase [Bacillota bacterium]
LKSAIADMSHDLRTPLTSVIGYLQFMKLDNTTEEERKEYLGVAWQRAKALESLMDDFYALSVIDSAEYELSLEKLDLCKALRELLVERYSEFACRKLEVNFQIPEKNIYIIGDKKSVDRVIENLLSNVLKYAMDKAQVSLEASENTATLRMSNNVAGLNSEDLEKLFDRFYMADKTRSGQGTGLGLAIAKALMEKMNGDIKVSMEGDMLSICCEFRRTY